MDKQQLRALASYFRNYHGTESFLAALAKARSLSDNGEMKSALLWNQIAEEIRRLDACPAEYSAPQRGDCMGVTSPAPIKTKSEYSS